MQKVEPGYNILSVFTPVNGSRAGNESESRKITARGLAMAFIGAFLVVASAASILQFVIHSLSSRTLSSTLFEEKAAYQPSHLVTRMLTEGYLGK